MNKHQHTAKSKRPRLRRRWLTLRRLTAKNQKTREALDMARKFKVRTWDLRKARTARNSKASVYKRNAARAAELREQRRAEAERAVQAERKQIALALYLGGKSPSLSHGLQLAEQFMCEAQARGVSEALLL